MQHINQIVGNPSLSAAGESRRKYSPTSRQEKLVSALWQRMRQLFGHKWVSQAGPVKLENGRYSPEFLLWCRKLEGLSDEEYQRGFHMLEHKVREAARQGDEEWPPSYAGFIGLCEKPVGSQAHRIFDRSRALEDKTEKERQRQVGIAQCSELLGMFDDETEG